MSNQVNILASAFVRSESENARLREFVRWLVRYVHGEAFSNVIVVKAKDVLNEKGWRSKALYSAMIRHMAQAIFNRECERAYARGIAPHHAPGTLVESMPPSYCDDYIKDAEALFGAIFARAPYEKPTCKQGLEDEINHLRNSLEKINRYTGRHVSAADLRDVAAEEIKASHERMNGIDRGFA